MDTRYPSRKKEDLGAGLYPHGNVLGKLSAAPPTNLGKGANLGKVMSNQPGMLDDKRPRWDPYLQFLEHPGPRCPEPESAQPSHRAVWQVLKGLWGKGDRLAS